MQLEHPSPVMLFPSSHCSAPSTKESPQIAVQLPPVVLEEGQVKPVYVKQEEEQPSPSSTFPSSQVYGLKTIVSPQMGAQTDGWPEQLYPVYTVQVGEQPSPVELFPSSHYSKPRIRESPQMAEQLPPVELEEGQIKPV